MVYLESITDDRLQRLRRRVAQTSLPAEIREDICGEMPSLPEVVEVMSTVSQLISLIATTRVENQNQTASGFLQNIGVTTELWSRTV
jgi:hypothetical protein